MENLENTELQNSENNENNSQHIADSIADKLFNKISDKVNTENKSVHSFNIGTSKSGLNAEFKSFLTNDVLKAMTTTTDPVLVPAQYSDRIIEAFGNFGVARRNSFVQHLDSNQLIIPRVTTTANPVSYYLAEGSSSADTKIDTQSVVLNMQALQSEIHYTKEMLSSSKYDVLGLAEKTIKRQFAKTEDTAAFMGANTVSYPFTGLFNDAGILSYTQSASGSINNITFRDLRLMEAKLDGEFRPGAKWVFDPSTFAVVAGMLDTTNRPIFNETLNTILGYPYEVISTGVLNSTSVTAAGTKYFALANMSEAIWVADNSSLEVLVDPYTLASSRKIRYIFNLLSAVGVANPNAGVIYKIQ